MEDTFGSVEKESLLKEIMDEVEDLNRSIKELCPEIISTSIVPSINEHEDEMSRLIEHRINLLTKDSKVKSDRENK